MLFEPLGGGEGQVYLGVPEGEGVSAALESSTVDADTDLSQLARLWQIWSSIVERGRHVYVGSRAPLAGTPSVPPSLPPSLASLNLTFVLHTSRGSVVSLPATASLGWPRVSAPPQLTFPPTAVGNSSVSLS